MDKEGLRNLALEIVAMPFGLVMELLLCIVLEFFVASIACQSRHHRTKLNNLNDPERKSERLCWYLTEAAMVFVCIWREKNTRRLKVGETVEDYPTSGLFNGLCHLSFFQQLEQWLVFFNQKRCQIKFIGSGWANFGPFIKTKPIWFRDPII